VTDGRPGGYSDLRKSSGISRMEFQNQTRRRQCQCFGSPNLSKRILFAVYLLSSRPFRSFSYCCMLGRAADSSSTQARAYITRAAGTFHLGLALYACFTPPSRRRHLDNSAWSERKSCPQGSHSIDQTFSLSLAGLNLFLFTCHSPTTHSHL
jgi:hypothetical protein